MVLSGCLGCGVLQPAGMSHTDHISPQSSTSESSLQSVRVSKYGSQRSQSMGIVKDSVPAPLPVPSPLTSSTLTNSHTHTHAAAHTSPAPFSYLGIGAPSFTYAKEGSGKQSRGDGQMAFFVARARSHLLLVCAHLLIVLRSHLRTVGGQWETGGDDGKAYFVARVRSHLRVVHGVIGWVHAKKVR